jgi:hypothetical protein
MDLDATEEDMYFINMVKSELETKGGGGVLQA